MIVDYARLSRFVSHALRHSPAAYGLELDEQGWVSVDMLLLALQRRYSDWQDLTVADLHEMLLRSEKRRHEIQGDRIRALYGHSIPDRLFREARQPPELLYHGTDPAAALRVLSEGLKPMARQHVHLSVDKETAFRAGRRKSRKPIVLVIQAKRAHAQGVLFFEGNESVWLADYVSPVYISVA